MNLQPTLEDNLIILRPLKENDFDQLYLAASDPLIWEQHPTGKYRYKLEVFSDFFGESIRSKGALVIIDKVTNNIIGSSRFKKGNAENAVEIGWSFLSRVYWGGTYNISVKKLMMDYAFKFVDTIIFYIHANNIRSQKAVEKIGGKKLINSPSEQQVYTYQINKHQQNRI